MQKTIPSLLQNCSIYHFVRPIRINFCNIPCLAANYISSETLPQPSTTFIFTIEEKLSTEMLVLEMSFWRLNPITNGKPNSLILVPLNLQLKPRPQGLVHLCMQPLKSDSRQGFVRQQRWMSIAMEFSCVK